MNLETLKTDPKWLVSEYVNLDFFLDDENLRNDARAYMYRKDDVELVPLTICHIIRRSDDVNAYEAKGENENVLLDGEILYHADCSCELITDNDSYLIWFVTASNA